ncbi:MAG: hypothetical protein IJ498_01520 [Akkermansia sp.]|nr:hypothetical protein [Akkermansia sp.]
MKTENNMNIGFIVMRSIQILVLCSVVKLMATVMSWPMPGEMSEQEWTSLQGGGFTICLCCVAAIYLYNFGNKRVRLIGRFGAAADHVRVCLVCLGMLVMLLYVLAIVLLSPADATLRGGVAACASGLGVLYCVYCCRYGYYLSKTNTLSNDLRSIMARYTTELGLFIIAVCGISAAAQGAGCAFSRITEILF